MGFLRFANALRNAWHPDRWWEKELSEAPPSDSPTMLRAMRRREMKERRSEFESPRIL